MNLFLLRHGLAAERGAAGPPNDFDRPLTPKGRRRLRATSAAMQKLGLDFDLILSSPLVRARQTAALVARKLKRQRRLRFSDALKPGGDGGKLVAELHALAPAPENVLLVGHEPDLSRLIARLVSGGGRLPLDFKKGGLAKLKAGDLSGKPCARLSWLLTPKQMKLLA